jgi:hypothetical protein
MTTDDDFISEADLKTFDGWLRYQVLSPSSPEELAEWRLVFEEARRRADTAPKVGLMKLQPVPGEYRYAVALRDGNDLWLTLWVRRSRRGEYFIMMPRGDRDWDPHTSYHLDGTVHMKSHGRKVLPAQKRQPLTGVFRGAEHLGVYGGHGKSSGAIYDPSAFTGVVEVPPRVLGPKHGGVTVDLVEPGHEPVPFGWKEIAVRQVFRDAVPCVVITLGTPST